MNKEQIFLKIINSTLSKKSHIGDDCAILNEFNLAISQDTLVQDVHFKLEYMDAYEIGKKATLVNISDILASGAEPKYLTISLSGQLNGTFIEEFYKGINEICNKFNIEVIGGDLTGGSQITISICILGSTKERNISSRKNAKPGYVVLLAGYHGTSVLGLRNLKDGLKNSFTQTHIEPKLYPEISAAVATKTTTPYAMMDTSDGFYDALSQICHASGVGAQINYSEILKHTDSFDDVMFGGEDYGLLICLSKDDYEKIGQFEDLKKIGITTERKTILIDGKEIQNDKAFEHFKN